MYKCYKKEDDGSLILTEITDEIKNAFKYNVGRAYLNIAANDQEAGFEINEDNYLQSLNFDDCRYVEGEGIIGSCVAKQLSGKFVNIDSSFNIENREVEYYLGTQIERAPIISYSLTEDTVIDTNKTYYLPSEDGTYTPVKNPVLEEIKTYYDQIIIIDIDRYYLKLGTFIVQRPENDNVKDNTTFDALDYMVKFNEEYVYRMSKYLLTEDTELVENKTYYELQEDGSYAIISDPVIADISTYYELDNKYTLLELLQDICNQVGVELGSTNFRNADYVVEDNRFDSGVSCRDVLKAIAQAAFSWARIDEDNKLMLDFNPSNEITEEINYNEYYGLTFNNQYGPINTIVLKNSQIEGENITIKDEEAVAINGSIELAISDNPFAYSEETRKAIIEAGKALYGFKYIPITVSTIGCAYLNCKDKLKVLNMQDINLETYVFDTKISYQGIIKSDVETKAMTNTETKYQYDGSLTTAMRRAEAKVDKATQEISLVSQRTTEQGTKLAEMILDLDGLNTKVEDTTNEFEDRIGTLEVSVEGLKTGKIVSGGQNLIRNSVGYFKNDFWLVNETTEGSVFANNSADVKQNSISGSALELQAETIYQNITEIKNGDYFLSFTYKRIIENAIAKLKINDTEIDLYSLDWQEEAIPIQVTTNAIKIEMTTDLASSILITDLMLTEGTLQVSWSQNSNESYTDTVQIGKGVRITATGSDTEFVAEASGITINNTESGNKVAEFTKYGTETQQFIAHKSVTVSDSLLIQKIGNQTWFSSLL